VFDLEGVNRYCHRCKRVTFQTREPDYPGWLCEKCKQYHPPPWSPRALAIILLLVWLVFLAGGLLFVR
jgi:hypothetical protein